MNLPYVYDYTGQHSVTFTVGGIERNTWTHWGLIPSSRHSEPINGIWSQTVSIPGINGEENLIRKYSHSAVNSYSELTNALLNDHRTNILNDNNLHYDIFKPTNGSISFVIADQTESFFAKQQTIVNYMHGKTGTMKFADDPNKIYTALFTVDAFNSGERFSSISISYSVLN